MVYQVVTRQYLVQVRQLPVLATGILGIPPGTTSGTIRWDGAAGGRQEDGGRPKTIMVLYVVDGSNCAARAGYDKFVADHGPRRLLDGRPRRTGSPTRHGSSGLPGIWYILPVVWVLECCQCGLPDGVSRWNRTDQTSVA